jgi:hypothetical protein
VELIPHFINYTHEYGVSFSVSSALNGLECNLLGSQLLIIHAPRRGREFNGSLSIS